jgi:hypothetical protein
MAPARGMGHRSTGAGLVWALAMVVACSAAWSRPLVAFTRPTDQAAVAGPTSVEIAYRSDTVRPIVRVELLVDGREARSDVLPTPLLEGQRNLTLDTAGLAPGVHRLTARAIDAAGDVGTAEITVSVVDAAGGIIDRIPPAVSVYYPAHGSTVSGRVVIRADVTDSSPLRGVFFYVDGKLHTVLVNARPYEARWDTTRLPDGPHILEARARDAAGNEGVSAAVTVVVQNAAPITPQPITPGPAAPTVVGPGATGPGVPAPTGPTVTIPTVPTGPAGTGPIIVSPPVGPTGPTVVSPPTGPGTAAIIQPPVPVRPAAPELAGPPAAWLQLAGSPLAPPVEALVARAPSATLPISVMYAAIPAGDLSPSLEGPVEAMPSLEPSAPRAAEVEVRPTPLTPPALPQPPTAVCTPALSAVVEPPAQALAAMVTEAPGLEPSRAAQPGPTAPAVELAAAPMQVAPPSEAALPEPTEAPQGGDAPAGAEPARDAVTTPAPSVALAAAPAQLATPALEALTGARPLAEFALAGMLLTSGPQAPTQQPLRPAVAMYATGPRPALPDIHLDAAAAGPSPAQPTLPAPAVPPAPTTPAAPSADAEPVVEPAATAPQPSLRRLGAASAGTQGASAPLPPPTQTHRLTVSDAPQLAGAKVLFEGKDLGDAARPELIAGVMMVPLKIMVEAADGALYWFANERTARAVTPEADMTVKVGSDKASVNGEPRGLASAPVVKDGRLMVPLNLAADVLGVLVEFDPAGHQVIIRRP